MEKKEQEVAEEYLSSLADLNLNSKPLINMLTILAEENIEFAPVIVKAVEQHISKVNPDVKLPVLYLIDSIVKNVGREYIQLFSHSIVNIFCGVFEKVNEKIREKMYTLRQTWNDVFTPQKLYTLDVKVNCMDPNWPITAKVVPKSPAIHVNPNFLKNKTEPINEMHAKLRDKQRQLLELQKRKLELELEATKQRLEEQEKQLNMQTESVKPVMVPTQTIASTTIPGKALLGQYKSQARHSAAVNLPSNFGIGNMAKTRVAQVNSAILSSIRQRDPRLARQQGIQHQSMSVSEVKTDLTNTVTKTQEITSQLNDTQNLTGGDVSEKLHQKPTISTKSHYGSKDKQRNNINMSSTAKRPQSKGHNDKISLSDGKSPIRQFSNSRSKIHSTSSKSSKGSSKDNKNREKSSSSSSDRRKSSKTDSPGNNKISEKSHAISKREKSPTKKHIDSMKVSSTSSNITSTKFKDLKQDVKSRNYIRRNREKSRSPTPPPSRQDVDFRTYSSPEKKMKLESSSTNTFVVSEQEACILLPANNVKPEILEKNLEAATCKDVDLRQFHANAKAVEPENAAASSGLSEGGDNIDTKKRSIPSTEENQEPIAKKMKPEKIDNLFGTEDVDLRTLSTNSNAVAATNVMPITPPPPPIISNESENWAKVKGTKSNKVVMPKSKLDDVRAKLAKATKGSIEKLEKDHKETQRTKLSDTYEDSEDGTVANIRTIICQAQEMLDSENMDVEQYNTLVKTVIHINESNKLKEAKRRESLLSKSASNLEDLTPISDDEVKFSSDEEILSENNVVNDSSPKTKILTKRIPKRSKVEMSDTTIEQNSVLRKSPTQGNSNIYAESRGIQNPKLDKRSRVKDSKWPSPWEQNSNAPKQKWIAGTNHRAAFTQKMNPHNQQQQQPIVNRTTIPNPWQNPPPIIFASGPPPSTTSTTSIVPVNSICGDIAPPPPPILLSSQLSNSVDNPNSDLMRTINIDNVPKEIRFYDEIAIAFMDWDQPKEIGFQSGQRRIIVDDHDIIILNFNDAYKNIIIDGKSHQMRFGCPTRELYIDNNWYECYFGDPPIGIFLDGRVRIFKIEGPAPQVRIGNLRQDLVVGKINLIIDARIIIPVFLDAKLQTFEVDDTSHTLQFADSLQTVLIDNVPFNVEYGGLPNSLYLNGIKHFIRFGTLPNGIIPGKVAIQNMICTERFKDTEKTTFVDSQEIKANIPIQSDNEVNSHPPAVSAASSIQFNEENLNNSEKDVKIDVAAAPPSQPPPPIGNLNIDELFQKLFASGILNQTATIVTPNEENAIKKIKDKKHIQPIDMSKPETIKMRQAGIIQQLFSGMQCSSCGVRFPPEQTMKYSQHLDWHFRQNRKERDSSRRAHSRKWYYDVGDWIQYEEIEDLEEREKNWFETQQNELENIEENSNQRTSSPPPSCPAGPDDVDKVCDMCHDKFEQFYNEESEEWHLRSAIRVEDKIYHPLCYEDYKASLTFEILPLESTIDDNATDSIIVKSEKIDTDEKVETLSEDEDDEDDVIVVPVEEPSITEIPDDDDDIIEEGIIITPAPPVVDTEAESLDKSELELMNNDENEEIMLNNDHMESDVEIQEPNIPFTDLDTYEENPAPSISTVDDSSQSSQFNALKIKEEPKDDGYEDDAFEDVGTFISADDISQSVEEYVPQTGQAALHDPSVASIDGNVEMQDTPTATVTVNRIKINITKNITQPNKSNVNSNESNINVSSISNNQQVQDKLLNTDSTNKINSNESSYVTDNNVNSIQYTLKPELQDVTLKIMPKIKSGFDTSGLCSIM